MLTERAIKFLKAPATGQTNISDGADVKGLILRVSQRSKIFYLSFRGPRDGKPAKIRIGEYPEIGLAEAREKGRAYRTLIERKVDPREYQRAQAEQRILHAEAVRKEAERKAHNTLARAIADFVAYCQRAGQRRWRERERQLRRYLPPEWSARQIDDIDGGDCKKLLERLEAENASVQANRVMQILRALYNWVVRDGRCERNPAAKLASAAREVSRDRVLADAELAAVWLAAGSLGEPFGPKPLGRTRHAHCYESFPRAEPYPIDALGDILGPAARAIHDRTQAPVAICAQSVLAGATLAAQAHADVELPTGQTRPISCYFLSIGRSGERKSAVDDEALRPIRHHEENLRQEYESAAQTWRNEHDAWEEERKRAQGED